MELETNSVIKKKNQFANSIRKQKRDSIKRQLRAKLIKSITQHNKNSQLAEDNLNETKQIQQASLKFSYNQTENNLNETSKNKSNIVVEKQQYNNTKELNNTITELNNKMKELNNTKKELNNTKKELNNTKKELNNKIKEIFGKQKFLQLLDQEQLNQWKINWKIFQEQQFDAPPKRQAMNLIIQNIYFIRRHHHQTQELIKLTFTIMDLTYDIKDLELHLIENISLSYFSKLHPQYSYQTSFKWEGVHIGTKIVSQSLNNNPVKTIYHVKTHSYGLTLGGNASVSYSVNLNELIVYKILQILKWGCESHFFGLNINNFCIGTKDAGYDQTFITYQELKKQTAHFEFLNSQMFQKEIIGLNLLSAIMRLDDLLQNPQNFGFIKSPLCWHIVAIDFRPLIANKSQQYLIKNKEYVLKCTQSSKSDAVINTIFREEKSYLYKNIKHLLENQFGSFCKIVQQSQKIVLNCMNENIVEKISEQELEKMTLKLNQYSCAIKENFRFLCKQFQINK